jgi:hypothetical protein
MGRVWLALLACRNRPENTMRKILVATLSMMALVHASHASAQSRCRVMDPTGTNLNIRTTPSGEIVGTVPNGVLVSVLENTTDEKGKAWAYIARSADNVALGWVFREFISCF